MTFLLFYNYYFITVYVGFYNKCSDHLYIFYILLKFDKFEKYQSIWVKDCKWGICLTFVKNCDLTDLLALLTWSKILGYIYYFWWSSL